MPKKIRPSTDLEVDNSILKTSAERFLGVQEDDEVPYADSMWIELKERYSDNAELASILSGSSDKKSKKYKAALKRVEVWKKTGKGPGKDQKGKTPYRQRIKEEPLLDKIKGGEMISIIGTKLISLTLADHKFWAQLEGKDLKDFLRSSIRGDYETAIKIFSEKDSSGGKRFYPLFDIMNDASVVFSSKEDI